MTQKRIATRGGKPAHGMTLRECAEELGVSKDTIFNDELSALGKIRNALESKFGSIEAAREILLS